jgi:hypothetical protein
MNFSWLYMGIFLKTNTWLWETKTIVWYFLVQSVLYEIQSSIAPKVSNQS